MLKICSKNHLFVFGSRLAVRPIHTTTPPRIATTPVTTYMQRRRYTIHVSLVIPRHDRSCETGRHSIARGLLPLCLSHRNPHRSCPAAERHECRAGHAPRRHVATTTPAAASRAAVRRRRIARAIPWVHARSSPPAGSSPLAHPPLRTPSAAGSHTAMPPRHHTATPPPCDQGQARRQYVSM